MAYRPATRDRHRSLAREVSGVATVIAVEVCEPHRGSADRFTTEITVVGPAVGARVLRVIAAHDCEVVDVWRSGRPGRTVVTVR